MVGRKRPEYSDFKNYYLTPIYREDWVQANEICFKDLILFTQDYGVLLQYRVMVGIRKGITIRAMSKI